MALLALNLAVVKKFTLSSFNYLNLYTSIRIPHKLLCSDVHNDVALGGIYQLYEKKASGVLSHNFDIRNKFSDATEEKTSDKIPAYGRIQKVYGNLLTELHLADTESRLGNAVKYILNKDIWINGWNMMHPDITSLISIIKKKSKKIQFGRFTPQEDELIKRKWNDLCSHCGIEKPEDLLRELEIKVSSKDRLERKQLNVMGCYLDPDLKKARHATEVVHRAIYILNSFVTGKYTPEEDKIILDEVERNGDDIAVFKDLCLKLNRNPIWWKSVRTRYKYLLQRKDLKFGKWTIDEDKFVIEQLFMNKELGIDTINSIVHSDHKSFQEIKRNANQVQTHYEAYIKPILLSYYYGKMDYNWKYDFLCYVVENKITSVKEIQWNEVVKLFPYQTRQSMHIAQMHIFQQHSPLDDLYLVVQEKLSNYKEKYPTEEEIEYRSQIVEIYLNCKK